MQNLKTRTRLGLGFGAVLVMLLLVTGLGIWRLAAVASATREMTQTPLAKERLISDWSSTINASVNRTTAIAKSSDPSLMTYFEAAAAESAKRAASLEQEIGKLLVGADEKKLFAEIGASRQVYLDSSREIYQLRVDGKLFQSRNLFEQTFLPNSAKYLDQMQKLLAIQRSNINAAAADVDAVYRSSRVLLLLLSVIAIVGGLAGAWLLARQMLGELGGEPAFASAVAQRIAAGDLSGEIALAPGDTGSLMFAMKTMRDNLTGIVAQVRSGTDAIADDAAQNAHGNENLSSRTEQQAASLEETAATMEQLTATVRQNADNAQQADTLAKSASAVAVQGGGVVGQVMLTMDDIAASARKIVDIISVIDGIAFQTNILALNAAVEAARAGEQGRGFAVVASEVRALAQRSHDAAKQIKQLIDDSVARVDAGGKLVKEAGATMDEVVGSVQRVTLIMGEILEASREQSVGIDSVTRSIGEIDHVTQQNALLVVDAAGLAEALQQRAVELAQTVGQFKLDGAAVRGPRPLAAASAGTARTAPRPAKRPVAALR